MKKVIGLFLVLSLFMFGCVYNTSNVAFTDSTNCNSTITTDNKKIIVPSITVPESAVTGALSGGASELLPLLTGK